MYPAFSPEIKDYYVTSLNTLNEITITIDDFDSQKISISIIKKRLLTAQILSLI